MEKIVNHTLVCLLEKNKVLTWISPKTINQEEYYRKLSFDMQNVSLRNHTFVLGNERKITL